MDKAERQLTTEEALQSIEEKGLEIQNVMGDESLHLKDRLDEVYKLAKDITNLAEQSQKTSGIDEKKVLDDIIRTLSSWGRTTLHNVHELKSYEVKTLLDLMY